MNMNMKKFDSSTMRFPTKERPPYPETRVQITGTTKNGLVGKVEPRPTEWASGIAVNIGGVVFKFYTHQVIELLGKP